METALRPRASPGRVFERDRGICSACGLDCIEEYRRIKRLRGPARVVIVAEWALRGRKSLWDADHIIPVVEGGGECDLDNMRTLCLRCHRAHTEALRARLKARNSETV